METCRMYENKYPDIDDIIIAEVDEIHDYAIYCKLSEYNDLSAFLNCKNVSRRRHRICPLKKRDIIYCVVISIDGSNVDISKKDVIADDIANIKEKWRKSKTVHSIFKKITYTTDITLISLYENFGWKLEGECIYDSLKLFYNNYDKIDQYNLENKVKNKLIECIKKKFTPKEVIIRFTIELTCFTQYGIDGIKNAAKIAQDFAENIKIYYLSAPFYNIDYKTIDVPNGIEFIKNLIQKIENEIEKYGGNLVSKNEPEIINL